MSSYFQLILMGFNARFFLISVTVKSSNNCDTKHFLFKGDIFNCAQSMAVTTIEDSEVMCHVLGDISDCKRTPFLSFCIKKK